MALGRGRTTIALARVAWFARGALATAAGPWAAGACRAMNGTATHDAAYTMADWSAALMADFQPYTLSERREVAADTALLSFALPPGAPTLGAAALSGVKVRRVVGGELLDKSYSPVSHPEQASSFELVVKAYAPRPGGGLGAALCALRVGETIEMKLKSSKQIHGALVARNRWRRIGLLGAGTGVAPFLNLIAALVGDAEDRTQIDLVASHRSSGDAFMLQELEALAAASRGRLRVHTTFTRDRDDDDHDEDSAALLPIADEASAARVFATRGGGGGGGDDLEAPFASVGLGRIDERVARAMLPPPADDVLVLVCGTDEFVTAMAGPLTRVRDPLTNAKSKVQGPTLGLLGRLGYQAHMVYKI